MTHLALLLEDFDRGIARMCGRLLAALCRIFGGSNVLWTGVFWGGGLIQGTTWLWRSHLVAHPLVVVLSAVWTITAVILIWMVTKLSEAVTPLVASYHYQSVSWLRGTLAAFLLFMAVMLTLEVHRFGYSPVAAVILMGAGVYLIAAPTPPRRGDSWLRQGLHALNRFIWWVLITAGSQ